MCNQNQGESIAAAEEGEYNNRIAVIKYLKKVFEKTCLCVGLSAPAIINNKIETKEALYQIQV